jgi:hypothetical protein
MTAVAAVRAVDQTPCLVGDVVLTDRDGNHVDLAGKIYRLAPNVPAGWSGRVSLAKQAIPRLRALGGNAASVEDLDRALDALEDLRRPADAELELTGWIVTQRAG